MQNPHQQPMRSRECSQSAEALTLVNRSSSKVTQGVAIYRQPKSLSPFAMAIYNLLLPASKGVTNSRFRFRLESVLYRWNCQMPVFPPRFNTSNATHSHFTNTNSMCAHRSLKVCGNGSNQGNVAMHAFNGNDERIARLRALISLR